MSSVLEKPVMQESRHYAPTVRSAVAVAAALLAVFVCYTDFPSPDSRSGRLAEA